MRKENSALKWIIHKAKKLKKKHPRMEWKDLVKLAGKKYREEHQVRRRKK